MCESGLYLAGEGSLCIAAHYDYAPFGAVTRTARNTQVTHRNFIELNPWRFSSEFYDDTLGLVYYNYRHYNPQNGRWTTRDFLEEFASVSLFAFLNNQGISQYDSLGLKTKCCGSESYDSRIKCCVDNKVLRKAQYEYYIFFGHLNGEKHPAAKRRIENSKNQGKIVRQVQVSCNTLAANNGEDFVPDYKHGRNSNPINSIRSKTGDFKSSVDIAFENELRNIGRDLAKHNECLVNFRLESDIFVSQLLSETNDATVKRFGNRFQYSSFPVVPLLLQHRLIISSERERALNEVRK